MSISTSIVAEKAKKGNVFKQYGELINTSPNPRPTNMQELESFFVDPDRNYLLTFDNNGVKMNKNFLWDDRLSKISDTPLTQSQQQPPLGGKKSRRVRRVRRVRKSRSVRHTSRRHRK
jgi:hypothetical protein